MKKRTPQFEEWLERYDASQLIDCLSPFLTEERKKKIAEIIDRRVSTVQVAYEHPADIHNVYACMRTADALGISQVHIVGPQPQKRGGRKTTGGANRWTDLFFHEGIQPFSSVAHKEGFLIAGACVDGTVPLNKLPVDRPLCLLFGNEHEGLTEDARALCDLHYHIPMYGMTESYNLSVSTAITLYETMKRKRETMGRDGDYTAEKKALETAWYYVRSVGVEKTRHLLNRQEA